MSGDPPESHFFSAEIDDDVSSGIADQEHLKTKFPSIVPDLIGISTDGPGVSTFNHAERTKLSNLFESIQSSTTSHNASEQDDDVPGQISVDLAGRAKPTIQEESGATQDFNFVNISEDVAIKAEEVDEEPLGGIAVTLIDESLDEVPRIPRHPPKRVENRLSDVSDEEKDRFPPARYRSGIEELVDCKCFRYVATSHRD
nr:unnamed protein product [Haemonchus contortus]